MQSLGPYELYQRLGAGATAEVFLASGPNPRGSELLAIKLMLQNLADAPGSKEVFLREARTSALLRHRNIVEIYEVGEVQARPFIAMELVRGWSLALLHKKMKEAGEAFAFDEACEIVRQAALGLHYIHEVVGPQGQVLGLIHRDVSPQNLIIDEQGAVKLVDFGLAKATAEANHTTGLKGKLRYMAPEQLKGEGLDRGVDVFALGAVLWELVCGTPLHPGPSEAEIFQQAFFNPQPHPDEVRRGLPRAVTDVLQGAVHRDKARRTPTAAALAFALAPLSGVDVGSRIAARLQKHFERLPRSKAELEGLFASPRAQGQKGAQLPAPPGSYARFGASPTEVTEPAVRPEELRARARVESPSAQTVPHEEAFRLETVKTDAVGALPSHLTRTLAADPAREGGKAPVGVVGALVGLSLLVAGFALSRRLFPPAPMVEELAPRAPAAWKSDQPPEAPPGPPAQPEPRPRQPLPPSPGPAPAPATSASGPQTGPAKKTKPLAGRPPRRGGKGKLRFVTSEPAEVFIGKKRYGLSNELLTLPSGRHRVELIVPGGERSAAIEVDVVAGKSGELKVALEPSS